MATDIPQATDAHLASADRTLALPPSPGHQLDTLVCETFGIPGREQFYAATPGSTDSSWFMDDHRSEVQRVINEANTRGPADWRYGSTVERVVMYPRVSQDVSAAMRVLDRLKADPCAVRARLTDATFQGFTEMYATADDPRGDALVDGWTCELRACRLEPFTLRHGAPTLPHAICLASLAMHARLATSALRAAHL